MATGDSSALGAGAAATAATAAARTSGPAGHEGDVRGAAGAPRHAAADAARRPGRAGAAIGGVVIVAIVAALIAAFATREGAGLTPDSRGYLLVAEQIALGHGLVMLDGDGKRVPLTHCPPLYPAMLWAGDKLLPGGPQAAARGMNVALFALNVALVGLLSWRASGRSAAAAILGAALAAVALDLLLIHSMVWTEPTFLLCTFASLYALGKYLDTGRVAPLALAALLAGLAFATRYAGAALMLASGLLVLFASRNAWGRRIGDAFVYSALSAGGMFLWLLGNARNTRDADGHAFAVHLPTISDVKNALTTVAGWAIGWYPPEGTPKRIIMAAMVFGLLVALGAAALLFRVLRDARRARLATAAGATGDDASARSDDAARSAGVHAGAGNGLRRALVSFVPVYVGFVLVSVSFFDAHVPLDRRILSPVHVVLIVLAPAAVALARAAGPRRAGVAAIALLVAIHGVRSAQWASAAPAIDSLVYASRAWRTSPTMAAIAAIPAEATIFTNGVDAIYLRADRFAKPLPKVTDPTKAARDTRFRKSMNGMRDYLNEHGGYVVYFSNIPRAYIIPADELVKAMNLELVNELPDGAIYRKQRASAADDAGGADGADGAGAATQPAAAMSNGAKRGG